MHFDPNYMGMNNYQYYDTDPNQQQQQQHQNQMMYYQPQYGMQPHQQQQDQDNIHIQQQHQMNNNQQLYQEYNQQQMQHHQYKEEIPQSSPIHNISSSSSSKRKKGSSSSSSKKSKKSIKAEENHQNNIVLTQAQKKKREQEQKKKQQAKEKEKRRKLKEKEKEKAKRAKEKEKKKQQLHKKNASSKMISKKHPDAPKRAKTAYICFMSASRPAVTAELGPDARVTEVVKKIAEAWANVPEAEKDHYKALAAQDKQRYDEEMANYTGPLLIQTKSSKSGKSDRKKGTKKDKNAPKRASPAFFIYSKEMRTKLREENPEKKNLDISKLLGEQWRAMPPEEKAPWEAKAKIDSQRYQDEKAAYNATKLGADEEEG